MKTLHWLSSLAVLPLVATLVLSGCGTGTNTQTKIGVPQGQGQTATKGQGQTPPTNPGTSTTNPGTPTPPPPTTVTQPSVDTAHQQYAGASIAFTSSTNGWIGGTGFILHTTDGGAHWAIQYQGEYQITKLSFPTDTTGFALGQISQQDGSTKYALLSTTDGGLHWNEVSDPPVVTSKLHGILDMKFTSATDGTLGNLATNDGGKTWQTLSQPNGSLYNPTYLDQSNGWLLYATDNTSTQIRLQQTTDGGKSWSDILSKGSQFPSTGAVIKASSPNDVWALIYGGTGMTQTSYSLFHTPDGGKTWLTVLANSTAGGGPAPGVDSATPDPSKQGPKTKPGDLDVVDAQTAYLTGSCPACGIGAVTVGRTTDGGKTWTNFPQQFPGSDGVLSFVTPQQGWLLVNTYSRASVLYETTDGGTTWNQEFAFGTNTPDKNN